jgi:hypothetical protein
VLRRARDPALSIFTMLGLDPGIHRNKAAGESPPFFLPDICDVTAPRRINVRLVTFSIPPKPNRISERTFLVRRL